MAAPHLSIGTATDRINLLVGAYGLRDWNVGDTQLDTIFQESQLADYRQMAAYRDTTAIETFQLVLRTRDQDQAARSLQGLRAMMRKIADFWTSTWQTEVVYLAARASCETNMRYAVCHDGRLVGESNPFGQPFLQPGKGAVMDALALIVERGPWLGNAPGTGTCVEISSQGPSVDLFALDFDGVDDNVNCGSAASLDDLPSADFTAEAWVMADGWGEGVRGRIFDKTYWYLSISNLHGIRAFASHAGSPAATWTGPENFAPDGQWHHVVTLWDQSLLQWTGIAIDGQWFTDDIATGAGAYVSDAAQDLIIGNDSTTAYTWNGKIGWCRISDSLRYTVGNTFTPPDRCTCPADDGDTVSLWCMTEGSGATAADENANANDGTITGAAWVWSDCTKEYMEATCEAQSVFVANKHNVAPITHIYRWDDSLNAWNNAPTPPAAFPVRLLPAVPAVDDFLLLGINTAVADSGPFSSLVFDISTISEDITWEWRYYNAAGGVTADPSTWPPLTVQDNTNASGLMTGTAFDTEGIGSVHWEQPTAWTAVNPNPGVALGVTGYWVCAYVTAVGGAPIPPWQDNRDIYTVTWPYTEFTADQVSGDMPALLRLSVDNRAAYNANNTTTNLWCQRVIAGLRSYDRGENFTAYINISDEQNNPEITITLGGGMGAFAEDARAPTGRTSTYTAAAADPMAIRVYIRLTPDFYGRFHCFLRGKQATGNPGEVIVRLAYATVDSYYPASYTMTRTFINTEDDQLLDFGEITLGPAAALEPLEVSHTYINIEAQATAASTAYFYELILIPIDEWAVDAEDYSKNANGIGYTNDFWSHYEIDGIRNSRNVLSYLIGNASGKIARYWRPITNGLPILQTGKRQRLWFLHARNDDYADVDDVRSNPGICSTIQVWKQQRYTTLRGDQ